MIQNLQDSIEELSSWTFDQGGYESLLKILSKYMLFDAAVLFSHWHGVLRPLASLGLPPECLGFEYPLAKHPRLKIIAASNCPHVFSSQCTLEDPFDGILNRCGDNPNKIHSCMGFPLKHKGELVGILSCDSLKKERFKHISSEQKLFLAGLISRMLIHEKEKEFLLKKAPSPVIQPVQTFEPKLCTEESNILIGLHPSIQTLHKEIEVAAPSKLTILISGETGTGKELVAHEIHKQSTRNSQALVYVNCAALPLQLVESELFGHTRGAFTGADGTRKGKFETADKGTLFLDEIGELPINAQASLLRVLQTGEIQRVGSDSLQTVDVRIIAATNRNLEEEVSKGNFRSDLYHRLQEYPLYVPPLHDRGEDIFTLSGYFSDLAAKKYGFSRIIFTEETRILLKKYSWPGNIRELKNTVTRAVLRASQRYNSSELISILPSDLQLNESISISDPTKKISNDAPTYVELPMAEQTDRFQREVIVSTVAHCQGNWSEASKILGMHRSNLHRLAKRLALR